MKRKLNYRWARKGPEDFQYRQLMHLERVEALPPEVRLDLKPYYPGVYDQGETGSCTAQAGVAVKTFITRRYVANYPDPSRMGFYYSERLSMDSVSEDSGSDGKTSGEVMKNVGVGSESLWPYIDKEFAKEPDDSAAYFKEAMLHKIAAYYFLKGEYQTKKCLAAGYPFVFGMNVPQQLMDDQFDGYLENIAEKDVIYEGGYPAGHQMSCFGYSLTLPKRPGLWFLCRNSWGLDFPTKPAEGVPPGHFWMKSDIMFDTDWTDDLISYRLAREPGV